jgi:uncharacterized protein (TIGR02246 family)
LNWADAVKRRIEEALMSTTATDYRAEVLAIDRAWEKCANAHDARGIADLYTENATLLPPGQPAITGRQNIQGFWQGFFDAGASDATLKSIQISGSGDLAYEIGEYSAMMPQTSGGTAPGIGKYLVVFERQQDGKLRMAADMFSPNA